MANQSIDIITKVLEQSAKLVEEKVDAQLSKLNEMDEDDLERLKERRLEALKKAQKQKQVCGKIFEKKIMKSEKIAGQCLLFYCFVVLQKHSFTVVDGGFQLFIRSALMKFNVLLF